MRFFPMTGLTGAEVEGADLGTIEPGSDQATALRNGLDRFGVLIFRKQTLDLPGQKRLTEVFGPILRVPYVTPSSEDPDVIAVLKEADEVRVSVFGGDWHSDFSFLEQPPGGSVLVARELPPFGGDTLWANQIAAWEHLPDDLHRRVDGRMAIHVGAPYGVKHAPPPDLRVSRSIKMTRGDPAADREVPHPIGRRQVSTGSTALFVNPIYTTRIEGYDAAESAEILDKLFRHATRPEFVCRLRWSPGTVAVWDNRTTLHYAVNDYDGHRRLLHRTTFAGERPV